jgi:4-hydroxybenzoate polyprenyltransferase
MPQCSLVAANRWLQLIRPANVVTALADVLAGYAVAGFPDRRALFWLLGATACLYAGGVVLNDVFDRDVDRVERPERPIPSGRVSAVAAASLGGGLLLVGVLAAAFANPTAGLVAALTAGCVLLYDAWGKRQPLFGPFNMGLCRGLNLLLGVAAAPAVLPSAWLLAAFPVTYIAGVTALSRGEVHGGRRGIAAFALISLGLVLAGLVALWAASGGTSWPALALILVLGWRVLPPFWAARQSPDPATIRRAIRTGVLSLALLDAAIGAIYGGGSYALVILATAVAAGALARFFSVT